ncbi:MULTISPECIES: RodZ family helix-turn-helix domain-containing protein [unclassified Anabaena]|uniref:helix-turn-helix domain-containing protein n=1 Tax=unclassified Anabaena TaxID=2619674 RepID=UPI00082ABF70|nr:MULTISPECIES: helix-turn-helix transcriptional regulator [unclassified Anabaena]
MTTTGVYLLNIPGRPSFALSQDELRSLLSQIETELHRSQVYRRIVSRLQILLGASGQQAKVLCKAIGREAISITCQQFVEQQQQNCADIPPNPYNTYISPNFHPKNPHHSSTCSTPASLISEPSETNTHQDSQSSASTEVKTAKDAEHNPVSKLNQWLKSNKKPAKTNLAEQIAEEQRLETMRKIGLQLKQARESKKLSLSQLYIYTHISPHQMEAVENANFDVLPEDVCLRGFIRVMANALGLNGTILAASLPKPTTEPSVVPSWCQQKTHPTGLKLELRPLHLYVGYTALVAGAVGGLSYISQSTTTDSRREKDIVPPSSSVSPSPRHQTETVAKPGIKSGALGKSVGNDISPPEALEN